MDVEKDGKTIGVISSGSMSPCLKTGIAMAYVDHGTVSIGDTVDIMVRGKSAAAEVVKPPFVKKNWAETH
jgi:aminomethyltransferase